MQWASFRGALSRLPRHAGMRASLAFPSAPDSAHLPSQSDAQSCDGIRSGSLSTGSPPPRVQSMEAPVPSDKQALLAGLKAQSKARRVCTVQHSRIGVRVWLTPVLPPRAAVAGLSAAGAGRPTRPRGRRLDARPVAGRV